MSLYDWDTNPANNTSKPGIDWSESMLPSAVNNSARQMMADLKAFLASPTFTGTATVENLTVSGTATIASYSGTFGAILTTGNGVTTADAILELGGARTAEGGAIVDFHATSGSDYDARLFRIGGANGPFSLTNTGTGDFQINQAGGGAVTLSTNSLERMRISANGNVGIGTTSPVSPLDIRNDVDGMVTLGRSSNNAWNYIRFYTAGTAARGLVGADPNNDMALYGDGNVRLYSGGVTRIYIASDGNIGIGTTTPAVPLHVIGQTRADVYSLSIGNVYWSADNSRVTFNNDANDTYSYDRVNNLHEWYINGARRAYLDGIGNFTASGSIQAPQLFDNGNRVLTSASGAALIATQSLGSPGYIRLTNGLTLQWGETGAVGGEGAQGVTFPIAFTSTVFSVSATAKNSGGAGNDIWTQVSGVSTSGFSVYWQATSSGNTGGGAYWFAIGI